MVTFDANMQERYAGVNFGILHLSGFAASTARQAEFTFYAQGELHKIRERHAGYDRKQFCKEDKIVLPYVTYFKKFKKTYPVLLQIESMLEGKEIPATPPLVQAMFLTELCMSVLLSAHDLQKTEPPFNICQAGGGETYIAANGQQLTLKPKDIFMADGQGPVLSVIYGQDAKTRVTVDTTDACYVLAGVPGLSTEHCQKSLAYLMQALRIFCPEAKPSLMEVIQVPLL